MLKKIKILIKNIKQKMFYSRCYNNMEGIGIAVFGMCSGALKPNVREEICPKCSYFRNIGLTDLENKTE